MQYLEHYWSPVVTRDFLILIEKVKKNEKLPKCFGAFAKFALQADACNGVT